MVVSMRPDATEAEIRHVFDRIREFGYEVRAMPGERRMVIGAVGSQYLAGTLEALEATPGV